MKEKGKSFSKLDERIFEIMREYKESTEAPTLAPFTILHEIGERPYWVKKAETKKTEKRLKQTIESLKGKIDSLEKRIQNLETYTYGGPIETIAEEQWKEFMHTGTVASTVITIIIILGMLPPTLLPLFIGIPLLGLFLGINLTFFSLWRKKS